MKRLYKFKEWKVDYDAECDEMFCGVLPQPEGENVYVDGVMYHFTKDGQIAGFFIEYFKSLGIKEYKNLI